MRNRYSASYFLSTGFKSFGRNWFMNISAIVILVSAMLVCGSFLLVFFNLEYNINQIDNFNQILVYADLDATDEELSQMKETIMSHPNVTDCILQTKEESIEIERRKYSENGGESLFDRYKEDGKNPLPDTYIVTFDDTDNFESVKLHLDGLDNVMQISAHQEIADRVDQIKQIIAVVCAVLTLLLVIVSLVIISNTIKLTLRTREDEITIMRYIGATNTFITLPFVVEALIVATISTAVAFAVQYFSYNYLVENVAADYGIIRLYSATDVGPYMLIGFAAITYFVCIIGSITSTRRYMKA